MILNSMTELIDARNVAASGIRNHVAAPLGSLTGAVCADQATTRDR
jgi:hypothetical protein